MIYFATPLFKTNTISEYIDLIHIKWTQLKHQYQPLRLRSEEKTRKQLLFEINNWNSSEFFLKSKKKYQEISKLILYNIFIIYFGRKKV